MYSHGGAQLRDIVIDTQSEDGQKVVRGVKSRRASLFDPGKVHVMDIDHG